MLRQCSHEVVSGLMINFFKSKLLRLRVEERVLYSLASLMDCKKGCDCPTWVSLVRWCNAKKFMGSGGGENKKEDIHLEVQISILQGEKRLSSNFFKLFGVLHVYF